MKYINKYIKHIYRKNTNWKAKILRMAKTKQIKNKLLPYNILSLSNSLPM